MSRPSQGMSELVAFKVTPAERARLWEIARVTDRTPSDVLRRLIALAEPTRAPDLLLNARGTEAMKT